MPIKLLSAQLASQIAAGEVVERPASVVKELVENAIDAGAATINVDIRAGGKQLILVADDGSGIPSGQIEIAFERHSTSKLSSVKDLDAINTLGFRGEALAAIAAVSQLTVVSRAAEEEVGTRLSLEGGKVASRENVGAPQGTVISVANLFFNTPARLKFLKAPGTEKRIIDELITRYALVYPQIRFRLVHDGRITFQSTGSGDRRDVLTAIYGPETARQLLEIPGDEHGPNQLPEGTILVNGFVSPPNLHRSNRKQISLYVNDRWIKDNSLSYAIIQAYHTLLPTGRFPLAAVFVSIPLEAVDVNVHPSKTEVRFRQANQVFGAVQRSVRRTLLEESPIPSTGHFSTFQSPSWSGSMEQLSFSRRSKTERQDHSDTGWQKPPDDGDPTNVLGDELVQGGVEEGSLPIMRVIGQVGAAYIITEGPEGLFLIDQHAAHERILYESFMAAWETDGGKSIATQRLINSETVHFTPDQTALLEQNLPLLEQIGFEVESFGPNSFVVRGVPGILTKANPAAALTEVVDELEYGHLPMQGAIEAKIILRVCKSAAIKAGQTLSKLEMEELIHQLEVCQNPHTCPHGRPTLIHLSAAQLAREFGRT